MSLILHIQKQYEASRIMRQNGNAQFTTSPYFFSIYGDTVRENVDIVRAVSSNPDYIVCCIKFPYQSYGRNYIGMDVFDIVDNGCNSLKNLKLSRWYLDRINFVDNGNLNSFLLVNNDDESKSIDYNTMDFQFVSDIRFTVKSLWEVFNEIDLNCETSAEGHLYLKYYLQRSDLKNSLQSLDHYKQQLLEQKDLNKQYSALLKKIEDLLLNNGR
ncbi:hypothetical protein EON78_00740 [bacterium]|nr:MAG: hypothetical protein EON78_00740 [bacterium]